MRAPDLDELAAREAIRSVLYRYCRGIDRLDRALVRSCYHDDATDEHGSFSGSVEEYLDWSFSLLADYDMTWHVIHNVTIEVRGSTARTESYGVSLHRSGDPSPRRNLTTGFRFLDVFECRDGDWRLASRRAVTDWTSENDQAAYWNVPPHLLQGARDATDASVDHFDWR